MIDKERFKEIIKTIFAHYLAELWIPPSINTEFIEAKETIFDIINRQPTEEERSKVSLWLNGAFNPTHEGHFILDGFKPQEVIHKALGIEEGK